MIRIFKSQIYVSGEITTAEFLSFSSAYPASIDLYADMKKSIRYSNAKIDEQHINIKTSKSNILTWHYTTNSKGKITMSWILSELSYSYKSQQKDDFVILNLPFDILIPQITEPKESLKRKTIIKNGSQYEFYKKPNINLSAIKVHSKNKHTIDEILIHLSFYFNININVSMKSTYENNKIKVFIRTINPATINYTNFHSELIYIDIDNNNSFEFFFQNSSWQSKDNIQKAKLEQAIYTFTRCTYCDNTMQFILLYSILDSYAGNSRGISPYKTMATNMHNYYNIDINKIGKENDSLLQKMQLYLKRDNGKDANVTNFCLLRNYILHFMSKPIIDEYLERSELVSKLRFAVCIIILHELGFHNLSFKKDWKHLSILKDS